MALTLWPDDLMFVSRPPVPVPVPDTVPMTATPPPPPPPPPPNGEPADAVLCESGPAEESESR